MVADELYIAMNELVQNVDTRFKRYLYSEIAWDARMIGLMGPRGVGKSTLLLQRIKEMKGMGKCLYVSADNLYFSNHTLVDLSNDFAKEAGTHLLIDEVHKYQGWSRELKNIYDMHPNMRIVFTGSSILDIMQGEADLSRRALMYNMQGLSFREFLDLRYGIATPQLSTDVIVAGNIVIDGLPHPLPLFREYLRQGYYPFSAEPGFSQRLQQTVSQTIEVDIPSFADMRPSTAVKFKRLLAIIAQLAPYKPNMSHLATSIGVSKNNIQDYIAYLERAGLLMQLRNDVGGLRELGKVEKVYIDNPNLMYALGEEAPNIGNLRETFFFNQMRVRNKVLNSAISDFTVGDRTFEVGGRNKGQRQIADVSNAYVVKDDIEYSYSNVLPLWYFGLNY